MGIIVKDVVFNYPNGFCAIDGVSINIEHGEKIAIIGQNGAGKTTFVKMMNNLLRPTEGTISVDDVDLSTLTTAQISRKVGYVFQNPGDQLFNRTVFDEIAYNPRYNKLGESKVKELVEDAAEMCGITEFLKSNPYDLPFGMRKFVTIACVIAMGSEYIILDEPTAGQDLDGLKLQSKIIDELIKRDKTVIIITHDMEFVIDNFERIIVMANKKIVTDSNSHDVFWDFDVLEKANLKQPSISKLGNELGITGIVNIDEFLEKYRK
ncbi:Energy-coupling factor transporter ATP-binding protein EcfA2 [Candidatus Izimaplasma bacterium HR1]|jgi:energy-coupling factor transport system ATP-binding protein|uniref:energy-coupling factor ABC transporter ATP-binding protein n=1 Tax=Candidatus Izimoplasma sp. HR1 TaxID=1541959 RepID=UPI0004F61CC3|nr:Energy-coupling factor transporter ATP-binding protein EcfA2 [Candidatus Izimaplasma bacterium HR1]